MQVANDLGLSLSALVNAFLTQLVKTKRIELHVDEIPTEFVRKILKQAHEDREKGKASPIFDNADDAIGYLKQQGV